MLIIRTFRPCRELSRPVDSSDSSAEGKARLYYQTCIHAQNQEEKQSLISLQVMTGKGFIVLVSCSVYSKSRLTEKFSRKENSYVADVAARICYVVR